MSTDQLDEAPATIKSAERVMSIAELLTEHYDGLTFSEIQEHLSIPKSSLHNLLKGMLRRGHLGFDGASRRFLTGIRYWEAGQAFERRSGFVGIAHDYLGAASRELRETVQLGVLDGLDNVYIAKVEADQRLQLMSHVGGRLPAHATGLGKVLLAHLDPEDLRQRLLNVELETLTESTITSKADLARVLSQIRESGYATDYGESTPGVFCVAVPVRDRFGRVVSAMSCSIPQVRIGDDTEFRALAVLRTQSLAFSSALGYRNEVASNDSHA